MSFREIDEAHRIAAQQGGDTTGTSASGSLGRGRKRKGTDPNVDMVNAHLPLSERRTGRWTMEEMAYCDKLIDKFSAGEQIESVV